jgi:hypothetical protein
MDSITIVSVGKYNASTSAHLNGGIAIFLAQHFGFTGGFLLKAPCIKF